MLKSLELPDGLHVRVLKDKTGDRGLLRRWMLIGGPWGHGSRCYLINSGATSFGSPLPPPWSVPSQETWDLRNIFVPYVRASLSTD